jgi:hypothetical protein
MAVDTVRPPSEEPRDIQPASIFQSSPLTAEALASDENYVLTIGFDCECGTHTDVPHDTGAPLRDLEFPYTGKVSYACPGCGAEGGSDFTIHRI